MKLVRSALAAVAAFALSHAAAQGLEIISLQHRTVEQVLPVLRPLLDVPREAIRNYLNDHRITWSEDSSNRSTKYRRNRVRIAIP